MFKNNRFLNRRQMSQEKKQRVQGLTKRLETQIQPLSIVSSGVTSQRVHMILQNMVDATDPTIAWKGLFTVIPNCRKRHLVLRNIQYVIANWTQQQFPNVIYVLVNGVNGYLNKSLLTTQRVAALQLSQISAVMDESNVRTYDLKYVLRDSVTWQIPLTLVNVVMKLQLDQSPLLASMPLPSPLTINLQLRSEVQAINTPIIPPPNPTPPIN